MKQSILTLLLVVLAAPAWSQRNLVPGKSRKDVFGTVDRRDLTKHGLQITLGPVYTFTKRGIDEHSYMDTISSRPSVAEVDPAGRLGFFVNAGMAHYRLKPSRFWEGLGRKNPDGFFDKRVGSNLFHRFDWGLGFAYIGGAESTTIKSYNPFNELTGTKEYNSQYYNGYLTARLTADRFTKIGKSWHLETGIGFNFNYNLLSAPENKYATDSLPWKFQQDFMAQLHAHIGMNYRIRRGDYVTFGFFLPFIGVYESNKLKPTIQWYSSNYYPAQFQIKWIHHFKKRPKKGCNTPGSEEDRKRNEEFLMGN
jgi:hypothetical protein